MKRRTGLYLTGALATVLVAAAVALAAVPQTITYQGNLTDSGGTPVNGTVNMTFRLYTLPTGTVSLVWTETRAGVAVTSGQYSVVLGSVTPLAIPFDVPYYLGVTVGSDAEMTPRLPLTSTGYAFHAAQADGLSSSATLTATNTIVSSVATGVAPLQVASTTLVPNLNVEMVGNMHASDFVAKAGDTMTGTLNLPNLQLPATTASTGIIRSGVYTLMHSYGNANFFAGPNAGNLTMTGQNNTASGFYALNNNTTGIGNTASGASALYSNTTGNWNTASGFGTLLSNTGIGNTASGASALYSNTTGNWNTASGFDALFSNTTGEENTAIGNTALYSNTTGNLNTAIGDRTLFFNTTGIFNTAIGDVALYSNTTGNNNTASGTSALFYNTTGNNNTASGYYALYSNTTGNWNTANGVDALYSNTTGENNIAIGHDALYGNTEGLGNTAIGNSALYSNITGNWNTANGAGALLINTTGFNNTANGVSALPSNTEGINNTAIGAAALYSNATGSYNTAIGAGAGLGNISGTNNTFLGTAAGVLQPDLTNATAIGYNAQVDDSNHVRIGNYFVTQIGGQVAWSNLSDMREKKDIDDIGYGLSFIRQLRPVQFRMKNGNDRIDFGFIAQDIEASLGTEYNILGIGGDTERKLSLRYTDFIAPMVKAMQEQQAQIDEQKTMIEELRAEITALKQRIQ